MTDKVTFTLDGQEVQAEAGMTIWEVANGRGLVIPHLCHKPAPGYRPDGNCRACMVEIEGERVLAASCIREPSEGMVVTTNSARAENARKMVVEMLVADQPERDVAHDKSAHLWDMAEMNGVTESRFPKLEEGRIPLLDDSHVAMSVNLDACIQCGLCVRACREVQVNDVIGMSGRGHDAYPTFDMADPMGDSTCVACGECVQACPTGALMPSTVVDEAQVGDSADYDDEVESICPFCGVGCQISLKVKDGKVKYVEGINGPANEGRLCVKGRFGFDYIHHDHRLTKPLIRREDAPAKGLNVDPGNWSTHFREASWDEALDFAANGMKGRGREVAGFGSAKCTNEEAYLFQKMIRQGFGHNNVDHCTRLCHASSVAALMENVGSGAVTATFNEIENADVAIAIGCNPIENHPVAATYFKQFTKRGGKLIVMDPRGQALKRILDGNALGAREHRLEVTRASTAAPLPGKSLNVYEPALGLITHMVPCEDAYTQERALLSDIPVLVEAQDLWVADRNFCVTDFFAELQKRNAAGLIREHGQIRFKPLEPMSDPVRTETGEVSEQQVTLTTEGKAGVTLRRIRIKLDKPDRNGEDTIYLLTQVPAEVAEATVLTELYRKRWRIEVAFLKMTVQLRCEINTLGYPKAALFGFAVAAVAFNVLAVIMAALRVAHPEVDIEQEVSTYYIANEMANMAESLDKIIDAEDWLPLVEAGQASVAEWLLMLAKRAQLRKYKKHPRGKKKPAQPRKNNPAKPHVATARLLKK